MIVKRFFIDRDTMKEYHAGDDYPRDGVSSERIAELIAKNCLAEDAPKVEKVEKTEKKTTTRKPRAKKG